MLLEQLPGQSICFLCASGQKLYLVMTVHITWQPVETVKLQDAHHQGHPEFYRAGMCMVLHSASALLSTAHGLLCILHAPTMWKKHNLKTATLITCLLLYGACNVAVLLLVAIACLRCHFTQSLPRCRLAFDCQHKLKTSSQKKMNMHAPLQQH